MNWRPSLAKTEWIVIAVGEVSVRIAWTPGPRQWPWTHRALTSLHWKAARARLTPRRHRCARVPPAARVIVVRWLEVAG
jgi:hypothetical protein